MQNSAIEWTNHTFNPWIGCTKVSPGCLHCYAETLMDKRHGRVKWGKGNPRSRTSESYWRQPVLWDAKAKRSREQARESGLELPHRPRVFCASLADWLDEEVPIQWLADLLDLIRRTPNLDWLLLTKRPENWRSRLIAAMNWIDGNGPKEPGGVPDVYSGPMASTAKMIELWCCDNTPLANVWIGTTVEDQKRADERIPRLLKIPAKVRFLSCEPLLGPVNLDRVFGLKPGNQWADCSCDEIAPGDSPCMTCESRKYLGEKSGIHWVIVGGGTVPKSAIHDPKLRYVIDQEIPGNTFEALGSIRMFTADKKILTGWLASQTDMLSKDWEIIQ